MKTHTFEFHEHVDFTGPPLTDDIIRVAESTLGYKLPAAYLGGC